MAFRPENVCEMALDRDESKHLLDVLKWLTAQIDEVNVPLFLDAIIKGLLTYVDVLAADPHGNPLIKFVLTAPALARQGEYIIDNYMLDHILELSQDKLGSHLLEAALQHAAPVYVAKIFDEVLQGYEARAAKADDSPGTPLSALEVMMFDQFGNYVIQEMLKVAREVKEGRQHGMPSWFHAIWATAKKNSRHLARFIYGRKILKTAQIRH
ncbi:PUM-HD domain-containing protein [Aphelenchoides fujianensis]|nr:PUM-HD domain-containing protein [Aphelenchoides fujianensis]